MVRRRGGRVVENGIEEAIERLEYIDRAYSCNNYYSVWDLKCIEILLSDYKRVLKENEELHKEIDRMKSLDIYKLVEDWETGQLIPRQKIKDKIEYLDKQQKQWLEDRELKASDSEIIFARNFLQELLKESEE